MRALLVLLFIHGVIPMPPSWDGISSMGCDVSNRMAVRCITPLADICRGRADGRLEFVPQDPNIPLLWRTFVWAEFPSRKDDFASGEASGAADTAPAGMWTPRSTYGHHERLPFSTHNPNQRAKALESCDQWMKAAQEDYKKRPPLKSHASDKAAPDSGTAQDK